MRTNRIITSYWHGNKLNVVYIRSCGEYILSPPNREKPITPDFAEIFWPLAGSAKFKLGKYEYTLHPGMVWYYPPNTPQDFWPHDSEFHYWWMTIAGKGCNHFFDMLNIQQGLNTCGACPIHLFHQINKDLNSLTEQERLDALITAFKILTLISPVKDSYTPTNEEKLTELPNYIEDNCGDPKLSVAELADKLNMHRGSFSRSFKRYFGVSAVRFIINCRMKKASELLKCTEHSITEIAVACGMGSAHYFSKVFASQTGMSPLEFRNRFREL